MDALFCKFNFLVYELHYFNSILYLTQMNLYTLHLYQTDLIFGGVLNNFCSKSFVCIMP